MASNETSNYFDLPAHGRINLCAIWCGVWTAGIWISLSRGRFIAGRKYVTRDDDPVVFWGVMIFAGLAIALGLAVCSWSFIESAARPPTPAREPETESEESARQIR